MFTTEGEKKRIYRERGGERKEGTKKKGRKDRRYGIQVNHTYLAAQTDSNPGCPQSESWYQTLSCESLVQTSQTPLFNSFI